MRLLASTPTSRAWASLLIASFVPCVAAAAGPSPVPWQSWLDTARTAQRSGDWTAASASYAAALDEAVEAEASVSERVEILEAWSRVSRTLGQTETTADLLERVVELRRDEPGSQPLKTVEALFQLGNVLRRIGPFDRAESALREALELRESIAGGGYPTVSTLLMSLHSVIRKIRPDDEERLALLERNLAADGSPGNHALLGHLHNARGRHEQALEHLTAAIDLESEQPFPSRANLATYSSGMARAHLGLGEVGEAERRYLEALRLREADLGARHPRLASTLKQLAHLHLDDENLVEAEYYARRALELEEVAWGATDVACGCNARDLLARIEQVRRGPGRTDDDAADVSSGLGAGGALDAARTLDADRTPDAGAAPATMDEVTRLEALSTELQARVGLEAALEQARKAVRLREEIFGSGSTESRVGMDRIGKLLGELGRHSEAVEALEPWIAALERTGARPTAAHAEAYHDLGGSLRRLGRAGEAERAFRRELELRETIGQRMKAAWVLERMGSDSTLAGEHETARIHYERAAELWREMAGPLAPELARLDVAVARTFMKEGRLDEAGSMLEGLLERVESSVETDPSRLIAILQAFRDLHRLTGATQERLATESRLSALRRR